MDDLEISTPLKAVAGHTPMVTSRDEGLAGCVIALGCSCGAVFARARFACDDVRHRMTVTEDGRAVALAHAATCTCGGQS